MDRITEVTRECFDALIQVRRLDDASFPPLEPLHAQMRTFIDAMFQRAAQAGFSREDVNDIAYAVVAFADEIVLSRSDALRDQWARSSLQMHYFHENVAGDAFFTRLETLRRDPRRREILRVYYLALLFGFQGGHRVRGKGLELMKLVEDLRHELQREQRFEAEVLSPHGDRPEERDRGDRRVGIAVWVAVGCLALSILVYASFRISLGVSLDDVVERVERANLK